MKDAVECLPRQDSREKPHSGAGIPTVERFRAWLQSTQPPALHNEISSFALDPDAQLPQA
jgi:hypothetical protein